MNRKTVKYNDDNKDDGNKPSSSKQFTDPRKKIEPTDELTKILYEFTMAFMVEKPESIANFGVNFFDEKRESRKVEPEISFLKPLSEDELRTLGEDGGDARIKVRRQSVFAEEYDPEADASEEEEDAKEPKPVRRIVLKGDRDRARITKIMEKVLIFRSLDVEQMSQVLDAMFETHVMPGEYVLRQGEDSINFYIIECGTYKVFDGTKLIQTYNNRGYFGEIALHHNMPTPFSILATTRGELWTLDRPTFRRILLKSAYKKRKLYESLLADVPMFKGLQHFERMKLADALISKTFKMQEKIFTQGDHSDGMYFIESGTVTVKMEKDDDEVEVARLTNGDYFGELALVTRRLRVASVYAESNVKVAFLEKGAFERIMGALVDVLKRDLHLYEERFNELVRKCSHS